MLTRLTLRERPCHHRPNQPELPVNAIVSFVSRAVQLVLAATLVLAGMVVALGLLAVMAVIGGAVIAVALVTGRRPQLRMGGLDPRAIWRWTRPSGGFARARRPDPSQDDEVIDVEVREIKGPSRAP
jgi:hypothetical protein